MPRARQWWGPRRTGRAGLAVPGALITPWALRPADLIVLGLLMATVAAVIWYVSGRHEGLSMYGAFGATDSSDGFEFGQPRSADPSRRRSPGADGVYYTELSNSKRDPGPAWIRELFGPSSAVPAVRPGDFLRSPGGSEDRATDDGAASEPRVSARYSSTDTAAAPAAGSATIRYTAADGEAAGEGRPRSEQAGASTTAGSGATTADRVAEAPDLVDTLGRTVRASRAVTDTLRERIGGVVDDAGSREAAAAVTSSRDASMDLPHPLQRDATDESADVRGSVADIRADERRIEEGLAELEDPRGPI